MNLIEFMEEMKVKENSEKSAEYEKNDYSIENSGKSETEIKAQEQKQAIVKFLVVLFVIFVLYYSSGINQGF